jgi:hypothetical protein
MNTKSYQSITFGVELEGSCTMGSSKRLHRDLEALNKQYRVWPRAQSSKRFVVSGNDKYIKNIKELNFFYSLIFKKKKLIGLYDFFNKLKK